MGNPAQTEPWKHLKKLATTQIEPANSCHYTASTDAIRLDFSHTLISQEIWNTLFALAKDQAVEQKRDDMVKGAPINTTENRAVGHMWLRSGDNKDVLAVLDQMKSFADHIHKQNTFTDIVHIGIGGSDLGPRLVCDALRHLPQKRNVHFVSNVDAADITETLKPLNPATTLFIIASKTFTTQETMMNAHYAKDWLGERETADHMIALSTNRDAVTAFGIHPDRMFPFWDWVGGRFSVWSSIGMPIALTYGFDVFQSFLNGGKAMDDHFLTRPFDQNCPILLALFGIWNRNFMNRSALAVLPYAQNLGLLPSFLQQLDMESNGKSVDLDGQSITAYKTGPIIFGQAGTNGQHAFYQWLHQGTDIIPCEFITTEHSPYHTDHHTILNAHAKAQVTALFEGSNACDHKYKHYEGNRPSITIHMHEITPYSIGQLIALYEHKIVVQGMIWNINSFDQFGVELGKLLAKNILDQN